MIRRAVRITVRRVFLLGSLLWTAGVSAVALYERFTVDPWAFLGQDRGAVFFRWAPHLDYSKSPFGDIVLTLDAARFWSTLLGPVAALGLCAIVASLLQGRRGQAGRDEPHARLF
jgi:hypothetical protein